MATALITAEELADELHIDQTPEDLKTLTSLIGDATLWVLKSISSSATVEEVLQVAPQFSRLVTSVAGSMYYDRNLSQGLSHGQMILLQQVTGIVDWEVFNGNI